jgi:hypothetical protein
MRSVTVVAIVTDEVVLIDIMELIELLMGSE